MHILISNDDGVYAQGIEILASAMASLGKITVVAPDRDRSGASNSLTLDSPLRLQKHPNNFYSVNGTPTDCVHLAITGMLDEHPDMVISGINNGANLGDDVIYSGTVAAAMEGRFLGLPAVAFSLASKNKQCEHFASAAEIAKKIVVQLIDKPLAKDTILNINIPDLPYAEIKGIRVARLGHRHIAEKVIPSEDPRGNRIYWVGPAGKAQDNGPDTDFAAIADGYVSVTPIKCDLTDYNSIDKVSTWVDDLKLNY